MSSPYNSTRELYRVSHTEHEREREREERTQQYTLVPVPRMRFLAGTPAEVEIRTSVPEKTKNIDAPALYWIWAFNFE